MKIIQHRQALGQGQFLTRTFTSDEKKALRSAQEHDKSSSPKASLSLKSELRERLAQRRGQTVQFSSQRAVALSSEPLSWDI